MEPISEELTKTKNSSTVNNAYLTSNTKPIQSNTWLSSVNQDDKASKAEINIKTPLLLVSSPEDELTEKLTKVPSNSGYHRGFSVTSISKLDGGNDVPLVPLLELPGPPDGGWGWVICFASFMCNFITDGVVYSYGVLLPHLVSEFQSTNSAVSWAGSLVPGLYMGAGPIVGGLVNKFGCRPVCMVGGIVACVSLILSTFVDSVSLLMLTYGLMGGFGFGMVYLPSVVSVGYYFEKKRALATGIAVCGSGVGCFAFAPLANLLVENTGWKWTNRTFGGFAIICSLMGALMRPLQLVSKPVEKERDVGSRRESNYSERSIGNPSNILNQAKTGFFAVDEILEEEDENDHSSSNRSRTISQKTEEDKVASNEVRDFVRTSRETSSKKLNEDLGDESKKANLISRGLANITTTIRSRHISIQDPSNNVANAEQGNDNHRDTFMRSMLRQNSLSQASNGNALQPSNITIRKNVSTPQNIGRLTRMSSNASFAFPNEKRDSTSNLVYGVTDGTELFLQPRSAIQQMRRPSHAPILRPLSRKDIFYSGSIMNINLPPALPDEPAPNKFIDEDIDDNFYMPESLNRYRHSIISIPRFGKASDLHRGSIVTSHLDIEPAIIGKKDGLLDEKYEITRPLMSVLKEMMDFASYMCNPIFLMVAISNILGFLAVYIPYIYLPDMMKTGKQIEAAKASFVISLIGVSNTLGRIVLGALVDFVPWNNTALVVTNICLILSGVCVLSFPFCLNYPAFVVVALLLGLFVSGYISLTSIVLVDLLGIDSLTSTFGLLVLFRGIASILGPPLGGLVYESSNKDYDATFYMAGALFIGAGIISELAHVIYLVKEKRKRNTEDSQTTKI